MGVVVELSDACTITGNLQVIDVTGALVGLDQPLDVIAALQAGGDDVLEGVLRHAPRYEVQFDDLLAPVARPGKFLGIGFNYRQHAIEAGSDVSDFPIFFNKQVNCISGPSSPIVLPEACSMLDYEGELAFMVGRRCRNVTVDQAPNMIGAWLVCNDISARDWQRQSPTITLGKSYDGFGPTGPWLVTPEEVDDPHALTIRTTVNGSERQSGSTRDMIYNAFELIAILSARCTLEPGDLVTTGSPPGSAQDRHPSPWLTPGDVVRVEIEGIGFLENPVVADVDGTGPAD